MKRQRTKNRVLLVTPDCAVKKSIGAVLETEAFNVLAAATGQQALRTIRDHLIDIVVLDDRTPLTVRDAATESMRTLKAITDARPFLPVVLACGTNAELDHATSLMADMILMRPVKPTALLDALDTVLEETLRERARRKASALTILG